VDVVEVVVAATTDGVADVVATADGVADAIADTIPKAVADAVTEAIADAGTVSTDARPTRPIAVDAGPIASITDLTGQRNWSIPADSRPISAVEAAATNTATNLAGQRGGTIASIQAATTTYTTAT
jgi:hypothetical protein